MSDSFFLEIHVPARKPLTEHRLFQLRRDFGATLYQLRRKGFEKRAHFAKTAGVTTDLITNIELGNPAKGATVAKLHTIAEALGCELELHGASGECEHGGSVTLDELFRMGIVSLFVER